MSKHSYYHHLNETDPEDPVYAQVMSVFLMMCDEREMRGTIQKHLQRAVPEEATNRQNIPLQEKFPRGVLQGVRNISHAL